MKYSLISFDMDGTLLDSHKRILPGSTEAIAKAAAAGKTVVLSTGRSLAEIRDYSDALSGIRYMIGASGAYIYDAAKDKMLYENTIAADTAREMFLRTSSDDVMIQLIVRETYMQRDKISRIADYGMGAFQETYEKVATACDDLMTFYTASPFPVYKFNFYCRDLADRDRFRALLSDLPITMVYTEQTALECSPLHTSKGKALITLCDMLDIPVEETISVGDGGNDIDQMNVCGLPIAMGNAWDEVKNIAAVTVADNDHGGCAEAIYKYLL